MVGNGKGLFLSIPFTIDLMLAGSPAALVILIPLGAKTFVSEGASQDSNIRHEMRMLTPVSPSAPAHASPHYSHKVPRRRSRRSPPTKSSSAGDIRRGRGYLRCGLRSPALQKP